MGELYEGILSDGLIDQGQPQRIKTAYWFEALLAEWAAGNITGSEAQSVFESMTGRTMSATLIQECQDIVATVTNISLPALPSPPGSPTAANVSTYATNIRNRAEALVQREQQIRRIRQILCLAALRNVPGYNTAAALRTKLGVPTR